MLKQLAMAAVALVIVLSAVSIATADGISTTTSNHVKVGNYLLQNATKSGSYNLSYVNDNAHILVANSINATGQTISGTAISKLNVDNMFSLGNMTVFNLGGESTLIAETQTPLTVGANPSITLNLSAPVSQVHLNSKQTSYLSEHSGSMASSIYANNIYNLEIGGMSFLIFSNVNAKLSNSNSTLTYSGNALSGSVLVGMTPAVALKDMFEKEIGDRSNAFTYNNTTGAASGRFVSFNFNDSSGVFTNYTSNISHATVFTSIEASGNGTIGLNSPNPLFPTVSPILAGSLFFYGNNTVVYQMHDNPSLVSNILLSNGTLDLKVAKGINISVYRPSVSDVMHQNLSGNLNYTGVGLGDQFEVEASSTIVLLHNSTFRASIFAHHATVSVNNTTGMISITTEQNAKISFVAPPGLQQISHPLARAIQYAVEHGKLAALVVLGAPGSNNTNMSVNYNSSMAINIQNVNTNSVTIKVASTSSHEGTNFGVFVPNGVIANNSKIVVTFDSKDTVTVSNISSVINATSSTQASVYKVNVNGGTLIIIHVPHFSNHTIQISTASSQPGLPNLSGNGTMYVIAGVIVVIALIGVGLAVRKRK